MNIRPWWYLVLALALGGCSGEATDDDDDDTIESDDDDDDAGPAMLLTMPLAEPDLFSEPVMGFDHDPEDHEGAYQVLCSDYVGRPFPHCYDGHDGSDFLLEGGFDAMDAGSTAIIAAADGTVVRTEDGHYDHCHGDITTLEVSCDGHEMIGNSVTLEHDGGWQTLYWHMMTDTVAVEVGDDVLMGDVLGIVGSSGMSSQPHLHFELQAPDGNSVDPYSGEYSQEISYWCEQGDEDGFPGGCDD